MTEERIGDRQKDTDDTEVNHPTVNKSVINPAGYGNPLQKKAHAY